MGGLTRYQLYIDGKWQPAASGSEFESVNPYTGKVWSMVPDAGATDVDHAVQAARRATFSSEWSRLSGTGRAKLLYRLADRLEDRAEEIARIESMDNGKVIRETSKQAQFAARSYRYFAGLADKLGGEVISMDDPNLLDFTLREPVGVCALIIAWNSPLGLLANKLAPALAAGNTVVVKPSEFASASILEFARLVDEVGFPRGVFNVVTGFGPTVGKALSEHPDVDLISLTGGLATGRAVATAAAQNVARLVLELGGKSPHIVFADADLERAVPGVVGGIFAAAGQTCVAGSRLLLQRKIYEPFMDALVKATLGFRLGDPLDPRSDMGPLANQPQFDRVMDYIRQGVAEGAALATGGRRAMGPGLERGLFVEPTVFVDAHNRMTIARDEIFGPVLTVLAFDDDDEAIALANDSEFGLAAGVWTENSRRAFRLVRELRAGTVWVNTYRTVSPAAPLGGYKKSGFGRERGLAALHDYMLLKNVMIDVTPPGR